jgi:hypothetical protein
MLTYLRYLAAGLIACGAAAFAQSVNNGQRVFLGVVDGTNAIATRPLKSGTLASLPTTCTQSDQYFAVDAPPGREVFLCYSTNTWIQSTYSQGTGAARPAACSAGQLYFATDAPAGQNLYFCTATNTWTQMKSNVTSVFGRTGAVTGQSGDYTAAQVTNAVDATGHYNDPAWLSLTWGGGRLTGIPSTFVPPAPTSTSLGGLFSASSASHKWVAYIDTTGTQQQTQPACGDLSNAAASCSTDTTNANNIGSGTLPAGRMPAASGDVSRTAGSAAETVVAIQGRAVAGSAPSNGQVLAWNSVAGQYQPTTPSGGGGGSITNFADVFDGSTTTLADGSTVAWSCGSGSGATCTTSWTVPANVYYVLVKAWSGGSGGEGSNGGPSGGAGGNGGGGGGFVDTACPVTPGNSYTVTVGLGGSGSSSFASSGAGGNSGFGSCFTLLGATVPSNGTSLPGYLSGSGKVGWLAWNTGIPNVSSAGACNSTAANTYHAVRMDAGGCGGANMQTAATAGIAGGNGIGGGGAGGGGAYNSATVGAAGTSGLGGAGGAGGAWTSGGGLVACQNGSIPGGGGGGGAAADTNAGSHNAGCSGGAVKCACITRTRRLR